MRHLSLFRVESEDGDATFIVAEDFGCAVTAWQRHNGIDIEMLDSVVLLCGPDHLAIDLPEWIAPEDLLAKETT